MAQSFSELMKNLKKRASVDLKQKKPQDIVERLAKMYQEGIYNKKKQDFAHAYIFFKRWQLCVEWLQKRNLDNETVQKHYSPKQIENVRSLILDVRLRIEKDYNAKLRSQNSKSSSSQTSGACDDDIDLILPDVPNDEPQPKEKDVSDQSKKSTGHQQITCTELLESLMKPNKLSSKKVVVIDMRTSEEFSKSRISFQDNLINIPGKNFDPKYPVNYHHNHLLNDKDIMIQLDTKISNLTELIVILDSSSSSENLDCNSPLVLFKNCLEKLKLNSKYSKTVVLKGGFEEWIKTYPNYVKPIVKDHSLVLLDDSNDASGDINFFTTQNEYPASPILSGRHRPGNVTKTLSSINSLTYDTPKSIPINSNYFTPNDNTGKFPSDRLPHVTIQPLDLTDSQIMMLNNRNASVLFTPIQDNTSFSPPVSVNGGYYENGVSSKQQSLLNHMKEPKVILQKLDCPLKKPFVDRSNKPGNKKLNEDIADAVNELDKVEDDIAKMERDYPTFDKWLREDYEVRIKRRDELMKKLANLRKSQGNKLYPDLTNMSNISLESKKKVQSVRPMKPSFSDEKENIQKNWERVEKMVVELEPSTPPDMEVDDEEIYKAPLKRSYSSPNLVQEKEDRRIIPEIDRSSKPRLESAKKKYFVLATKDRMHNLNAVDSSSYHPGITGLKNLGNSCYMNSIIQCLSNTEYLANYFNENAYTDDLKVEKNFTCVAEEVAHVVKALWRGTYKSISPLDLKVVVGHYKLQFKNHEQQDSHEFLTFLLEWMHNDLKKKSKLSYNRPMTTIESEWEKSMNGQSSMISKLFFGLLRSTVQCLYCEKNSTTYETFNSLTMSLPVSNKCTLDECLRKFVSGQKVSGWNCPNCKVPREGEKKFDIAKLPHIVVIHLNRFGDTGGWFEKKNTAVDFPLLKFDLRPYLVSDEDTINNAQSSCYNLYAISNHYGTMDRGHYTAYCKSSAQNKWYKYDDHAVSEVPQSQVKSQSSSAYLLFYTSISNGVSRE
ncbi:ubiquitin carboxyl-terminal hydrolase 8-like [Copidosoma floridanum]|uniref:ubiquitin carboxyl-terminal hydrolase 8-like n=1 Tax=Copidosoma floridanum TaxID=29053 RepID=UPI0006C97EBB|nr:ubiquitin carboxyl-terminal hydrolase 8-like [Copidosoma floridanum]